MSVIALENLSVSHRRGYELRTVVHEVNLRIEPGECFRLVGPSGCGKSSLLWCWPG
ncbi:ATP-binding cassette domain-containing protein [Serratia marcescens]|uniref:ATP-binding cassette domain-containing protein n=1 Tax=Serratia marcescens TaxID=615 RepID=A0A939NQL6_SERMA|nr:ATP-binding cassette domain-containing protein [Serratia marcescens]